MNPQRKLDYLLRNKQFWATVKFLLGAFNLPGAFFRLILKFIMSNETFSKPQYFSFTPPAKKKGWGEDS